MRQKIFPEDFFSKRSIREFKVLPSADVGIIEELEYVLVCVGETLRILIMGQIKKFPRGDDDFKSKK